MLNEDCGIRNSENFIFPFSYVCMFQCLLREKHNFFNIKQHQVTIYKILETRPFTSGTLDMMRLNMKSVKSDSIERPHLHLTGDPQHGWQWPQPQTQTATAGAGPSFSARDGKSIKGNAIRRLPRRPADEVPRSHLRVAVAFTRDRKGSESDAWYRDFVTP